MDSHNAEEQVEGQSQLPQSEQEQQQGTTFLRTCFNGINALSGVGILSIPYALSQGGWLSLLIFFLIAAVCYYTGLLLFRCMKANPLIKTYPDIGELAFGRKGRVIVSILLYLELYFVAVEFMILEGDNLHKLFPNASLHVGRYKIGGRKLFVALTALVVLPTTWLKNLGLLAYVSASGVVASVTLVGSTFWIATVDGVGFHEKGSLWRWTGLPTTVSIYTFCYCGHAVFPMLCNSMKDRGIFSKVILVCFVLSTISYGTIAIAGYLMYGENLMSQITLNFPTRKISSKIAIYTTVINPITKYAILMNPIATAIESSFPLKNARVFKSARIISLLLRTGLVISTAFVAIAIPFFGYMMAFTGAVLGISMSVLLPCLCYLKIYKRYKSLGLEFAIIQAIIVFGVIISVTGTYSSVRNIISHL